MSFALLSLTFLSILHQVTSLAIPRDGPGYHEQKPLAVGYYTGWHGTDVPLSSVSWAKYDIMMYAFAETMPNVNNLSLSASDATLLPQFVCEAHAHGVSAHGSVGGWSGSRWFSSNVATPENRTAFAQTVLDFVRQYNLDGINFDWEYPNKQGVGCNVIGVNDTQNFLSFLQELRTDPLGAQITISAGVPITPFVDASGNVITNVSGFAEVLDYVSIMAYDIFGAWSSVVGPNSPLNDTCAPPADQMGSAVSSVKAWTTAGMPANHILLGMATYGRSYSVPVYDAFATDGSTTELVAYPKFNASNQPLGDKWDDVGSVDACGVSQAPGGTFNYRGLIEGGFLEDNGELAPTIYIRYDECSQTPYIYNKTSEVMVSYENPESYAAKGNFIANAQLGGFLLWEVGGDHKDYLLDSVRNALGLNG